MIPFGLWSAAELSTGVIVSCLPVIPKFFQHVGPKVLIALKSKSRNYSDTERASEEPSDRARVEKLKLPSFKHTFTSFMSDTKKDNDHGMYGQETLSEGGYMMRDDETAIPRHDDATWELIQMPAAKIVTTRDDLERGYGRF